MVFVIGEDDLRRLMPLTNESMSLLTLSARAYRCSDVFVSTFASSEGLLLPRSFFVYTRIRSLPARLSSNIGLRDVNGIR